MKRNIVLAVFALALALAGCFHPQNRSNYPYGDPPGLSESSSTATVTATSTAMAAITAPPAPQPAAVQQPAPVVVQQPAPVPQPPRAEVRKLGSVVMYEATNQAPENMSVHLFNVMPFYACIVSPTVNGEPAFKLRQGNFAQDLLPVPSGWAIPCAAVVMPNLSRSARTAPSVWLAVKYPGKFNLRVMFFTFSGTSPQFIPEATYSTGPLAFPNIPSTNGQCTWDSYSGCLYNIYPQAMAENVGDKLFALLVNGTVSLHNDPLFPPDMQLAMLMSTPDKQLATLQ
ncbi:MAG: hypothetical protein PHC53_04630 [Patescibacteria group bacterium]|nr:hypothetical protein [Patescibacteria group bacterium]